MPNDVGCFGVITSVKLSSNSVGELDTLRSDCQLFGVSGLIPITVVTKLPQKRLLGARLQKQIDRLEISSEQPALAKFTLSPETLSKDQTEISGYCFLTHNCYIFNPDPPSELPLCVRRKLDDQNQPIGKFYELGKQLFFTAVDWEIQQIGDESLAQINEEIKSQTTAVGRPSGNRWIHQAVSHGKGRLRAMGRKHGLLHGKNDKLSGTDLTELGHLAKKTKTTRDDKEVALAETLRKFHRH